MHPLAFSADGLTDDIVRTLSGCDGCAILARATVSFPITGRSCTTAKLLTQDGRARAAAFGPDRQPCDAAALGAAEGAAKISRQGKLRDDAYAASQSNAQDSVPVWIWADIREDPPRKELLLADSAARDSYEVSARHAVVTVTSKIVAWLDARGYATYERGEHSPAITADVPAGVLTLLGQIDGVAAVGIRQPDHELATTWLSAANLDQAQGFVPSTARPFCNSEGEQPDSYANLNVTAIASPTAGPSWHQTWTTELVSSTNGFRAAPGATTYIADWANFPGGGAAVFGWCFQRATALNFSHSFNDGSPHDLTATDMTFDYYVKHSPYPLIAASAGNSGHIAGYDTVQNAGFNYLVVGAFDDRGTANKSDDGMASFSSWRNPTSTHGDRELPYFVTPGVDVASTSYVASGTSASAPIALGAALLAQTQDSWYSYWPEMMRASMIAASYRSVDVTQLVRLPAVDSKQETGALDARELVRIANAAYRFAPGSAPSAVGHYAKTYYFSTDFDSNGLSYDVYNIALVAGMKFAVAIAFDSHADGCGTSGTNCAGDVLDGDLDVTVFTPSGDTLCSSSSFDNSWEYCAGQATTTGTYTLRLKRYTTSNSSTYVGIAWHNY